MASTFALLVISLVVIGVLKLLSVLYNTLTYWKNKGLPRDPSILLSWKVFLGYKSFVDFSDYLYYTIPKAKYMGTIDFTQPAIVLRDVDLMREIMVKNFDYFPDHRSFVDESVEPLFGKNIFSLRGDRWREMRNTLSPSFTASKMKFMFELISKCSHDFVNYLVDHPELCQSMETKDAFRRYTNDVIATAAFGINVNSMEDRDNEFYVRGIQATQFPSGMWVTIKFAMLRGLPWLSKKLGLSFFPAITTTFFRKVVGETISTRREQKIVRPDMIHLLMQARDKVGEDKLTLDDIVSQAFIFFFAGFDTSSTLMCFAAHELAVHQDIQERLYKEVLEHLAEGNGEITYESMTKMTYMDMVLNEALRKYPPVVMLDRLCAKRFELPPAAPGYKSVIVEPENSLLFPIYSLHHDPKYFPNPQKFDPERFSEENKDKIVPYSYLPFGEGPRKCIGNRFVLMETKMLLAHLLQKFTLKMVDKTEEPVVFSKKEFTLKPVGGFWIGLEKRKA
ncbi:hypothetical protein PUN28_014675 [Cardiocondyla obscurior]|uniref:Cytochrome P450 9e2-like n=2 Tax=Cardiocondyla obscurior TaxID=286306 RepID=A0AAW2EXZ0_9HYME